MSTAQPVPIASSRGHSLFHYQFTVSKLYLCKDAVEGRLCRRQGGVGITSQVVS